MTLTVLTVHIHIFPLHRLNRCCATCMQETNTWLFFFFWLLFLKRNCDDSMFVVTVNHTIMWGFVLSILLSLSIISIIVCCMFDVQSHVWAVYLSVNKFHSEISEPSVIVLSITAARLSAGLLRFQTVWCSLLAALLQLVFQKPKGEKNHYRLCSIGDICINAESCG